MSARAAAHQLTEQIRQASDLADVVSSYVTLARAGRQLKALCPFHTEKTPSFYVWPEKQTFKCFGCGVGGDVFKFVQLREDVGFLEARAILADRAGIEILSRDQSYKDGAVANRSELERVNRWAAQWFAAQLRTPTGKAALDYALERGISPESLERFSLGSAPDDWEGLAAAAKAAGIPVELLLASGLVKEREQGGHYDAFRGRLMFPIQDALSRTIGFGGRTLTGDSAKYINSPQTALFDKSRCLYGLATAREALQAGRSAVLVEGYLDCILAHQFGFSHVLATLGTALTVEHVRMLRRYVDTVIVVFDSDAAGQRAADQSLPLFLTEQVEVRLSQVPEGKDPAEYLLSAGSEAFGRVLTSSVPALEFKWRELSRRCRGRSATPDRRRAVEEFLDLIRRSANLGTFEPIQRGLILNQVGKLLGISTEDVARQLRIIARRSPAGQELGPPAAKSDSPPESATPDAAVGAMWQLSEVLLNAPEYYDAVSEVFDPALFSDEVTRAVAEAIAESAQGGQELSPPALMARFDSVAIATRIVDMQMAGERRGNYEATVQGAIDCLRRAAELRRIGEFADALRGPDRGQDEAVGPANVPVAASWTDEERNRLREMTEAARKTSHFAARKHLAAPISAGAGPAAP